MITEILNEQLLANNGLLFQTVAVDVFTSVLVMTGLVKSVGGRGKDMLLSRSGISDRLLCVQLNPKGYRSTYRSKVNALRTSFSVGQIISFNRR